MTETMVWCARCLPQQEGGHEPVHLFSSDEKRQAFIDEDRYGYLGYVCYDYVVDHPERMEERKQ